jgi:hypothetical protein
MNDDVAGSPRRGPDLVKASGFLGGRDGPREELRSLVRVGLGKGKHGQIVDREP